MKRLFKETFFADGDLEDDAAIQIAAPVLAIVTVAVCLWFWFTPSLAEVFQ